MPHRRAQPEGRRQEHRPDRSATTSPRRQPILDSRLPDGSRVAAVFPPCSLGGTTLTIRKFQTRFFTADELVRIGTMTPRMLVDLVRDALAEPREHPDQRRHEHRQDDAAERARDASAREPTASCSSRTRRNCRSTHPNLVRFEARRAQADLPAVTIRDLLRATLRHRPDRIIVGEVRGGEAFDLLQALNTGHSGTLSTIHANSAEQALARFASCVVQSGVELPYQAIRRLISESIDLVLHLERRRGIRSVTEVVCVTGYEPGPRRVRPAGSEPCTEVTLVRKSTPTSPRLQNRRSSAMR